MTELISRDEMVLLAKFLASRELSGEQKDRIQDIYVAASSKERKMIAELYSQLFLDSAFMQRLFARMDAKKRQDRIDQERQRSLLGGLGDPSASLTAGAAAEVAKPRRVKAEKEHGFIAVRQAIAELPRLTGPGPFSIELCMVTDEPTNQKVIELYSTQFTFPGVPELQRIVTSPRIQSTRRKRAIVSGVFSWYILCQATGEIAAAITTVIHSVETMRFVEVPLCATASGYKKLGFARLLSCALQALCAESLKAEVVLVTAESHAVTFWEKCGYAEMPRSLKARLDFYLIQCHKFKESKLLTWEAKHAPEDAGELVREALKKMPKFLIENDRLPWETVQ